MPVLVKGLKTQNVLRGKIYLFSVLHSLLFTFLFCSLSFAGTNIGVTYQGRILRPTGEAVNSGVIAFSLRVFDPSNNCLLWSEVQNLNMANTNGAFSLVVGSGTRTDGGSQTLKQVFTNAGTLGSLSCTSGSTYSPTASDDRTLSVTFNDGGTVVALTPMAIKSAPFAMQADQVSGYGILNLAKISGAGSATVLTPFQYDFLANLAAPATASSAPCSPNDILKFLGGVWSCAPDATGGAPGDASYAAKGIVQFNTDAATSGVSVAAGIATINTGIAANQIPKLDASANLGLGVAPTTRLDVNGAITQRGMAAPAVSAASTGRLYYDSTANHFYYSENGGAYTQLSSATGSLSSVSSISNSGGNITLAPVTTTGSVLVNSGTPSIGAASGALVVTGGIGTSGDIYSSASINAATTMSALTSMLTPQIYGSAAASGNIKIDGTSNATKGNVLLASVGGNVGIGTSAPTGTLHVVGGTAAAGSGSAITIQSQNGQASGNTDGGKIKLIPGLRNGTGKSGTVIVGPNDLGTNAVLEVSGNNNGYSQGISSTYWLSASGQSGVGHGLQVNADQSGIAASATAVQGSIAIANGIVMTAQDFVASDSIMSGSIINRYGFRFTDTGGGAATSVSNQYGLYVEPLANATDNYAVYTAGNTKSYFGGNVGIGTAVPNETLQVAGASALGQIPSTRTTLSSAATSTDTILTVVSTTGYPPSGTLFIDGEAVHYTGVTATTFTGCTRGYYGSTAAAHSSGLYLDVYTVVTAASTSSQPTFALFGSGGMTLGTQATLAPSGKITMPIAIGNSSTASGPGSVAIGKAANASTSGSVGSIALGYQSWATAPGAASLGYGANSGSWTEVAIGESNLNIGTESSGSRLNTSPIFAIGNGVTGTSSSNAMVQLRNGQTIINSGIMTTATTPSITTVMNNSMLTSVGSTIDNTAAAFNATNSAGTSLVYARNDGNVGVGTASPAAKLDVTDTGTTTSAIIIPRAGAFTGTTVNGMLRYNSTSNLFEFYQNGAWVNYTTVSDARLKTNVVSVSSKYGLDIVNQLNPVFYDWDKNNPRTETFGDKHQVGFIAQEVEKVLPEVVDVGGDSYRSVQYGKIVSVVVAAVKELYNKFIILDAQQATQVRQIASKAEKEETDALKADNVKLGAKNRELEQRLESIENENIAIKLYICSHDKKAKFCK